MVVRSTHCGKLKADSTDIEADDDAQPEPPVVGIADAPRLRIGPLYTSSDFKTVTAVTFDCEYYYWHFEGSRLGQAGVVGGPSDLGPDAVIADTKPAGWERVVRREALRARDIRFLQQGDD